MTDYITRGPRNATPNGTQSSRRTANIDLSSTNWTAAAEGAGNNGAPVLCPRAFVPNYSGTLVFQCADDSADVTMIVNAGQVYPLVLKSITQASCSSELKVANAICIWY